MEITIGNLCDKLSILNIKIFFLENQKRDNEATNEQIAEATRRTNVLNSERSLVIDEIDLAINRIAKGHKQQLFGTNKMYGK